MTTAMAVSAIIAHGIQTARDFSCHTRAAKS